MSRNSRRHRVPVYRRPIFVIGALIIIVAAIFLVYYLFFRPDAAESVDPVYDNNPGQSSLRPSTPAPDTPTEEEEEPEAPPSPTQYEGTDPNKEEALSGRIAYHNVNTTRKVLTTMVSIDQYITGGGECILSLERGGRSVYTTTRSIAADVTTSVCGPFEIPLKDVASGKYSLKVRLSAGGKTGSIETEVNI